MFIKYDLHLESFTHLGQRLCAPEHDTLSSFFLLQVTRLSPRTIQYSDVDQCYQKLGITTWRKLGVGLRLAITTWQWRCGFLMAAAFWITGCNHWTEVAKVERNPNGCSDDSDMTIKEWSCAVVHDWNLKLRGDVSKEAATAKNLIMCCNSSFGFKDFKKLDLPDPIQIRLQHSFNLTTAQSTLLIAAYRYPPPLLRSQLQLYFYTF